MATLARRLVGAVGSVSSLAWVTLAALGNMDVAMSLPERLDQVVKFVARYASMSTNAVALIILVASLFVLASVQWPGMWKSALRLVRGKHGDENIGIAPVRSEQAADNVPISEAARLAFEAVEGTAFASAATSSFHAPRGALAYMATMMAMRVEPPITIYGKHLPSTQLLPIADDAFFGDDFAEGASEIREDGGTGRVTYSELSIKRSELPRILEHMRQKSGAGTNFSQQRP